VNKVGQRKTKGRSETTLRPFDFEGQLACLF
jgi:hypothetical protein